MSIRRLFHILLAGAFFAVGVRETVDPDLWWHLRTGALILDSGLPRVDPFSYTMAGVPWTAHEWLSDVLMWLLYDAAGLAALSLFFAVVIAAALWLQFLSCAGRPYLAAFVVLLAGMAAAPTWGARPQMFNLLFAALFILVLERVNEGQWRHRALWALPPLTALWANFHSGYLFGVVLCAVYALGSGLTMLTARRRDQLPVALAFAAAAGASFLAALLTPHGARLWIYPFETLTSAAMQRFIVEWQAPDLNLTLFQPFGALLALGVLSMIFSDRRPGWTELLLFFGGALAALQSARNIPLFAIAAAPIVARHLLAALRSSRLYPLLAGTQPEAPTTLLMRVLNVTLVAAAAVAIAVWGSQRLANTEPLLKTLYPVDAVAYIREEGLEEGRIFNSYSWGGYLIWNDIPVFADGRADVYEDFLFTFQQVNSGRPGWEQPLNEYGVDYVLIEPDTPLAALLAAGSGWASVYQDDVAQIFVRRGP